MTVRVVAAGLVLALGAGACAGGDDAAPATSTTRAEPTTTSSSTVPELPPSTTTTMFDPATVEGQVEAAYLESWDVYAQAVYHLELDEQAFARVYAGEHLETKRGELLRRIRNGEAALVQVDHDYEITRVDSTTYRVVDTYTNHQVLIDPESLKPIEADPDEVVLDIATLKLVDGLWKVAFIEEVKA